MPVTGATYRKRTKQDILAYLETEMRNEFGEDIDLTDSSAFSTFAEAVSEVDSDELEDAIEEVFDGSYLDSAEGQLLEKRVAILGLDRTGEQHATGTIEFSHEDTVAQTHLVSNGQGVQTDSDDPVEFETTESGNMFLRDDFEDGSLDSAYQNDTGNFSVVDGSAGGDPSPTEGSYMLKSDGTANVEIHKTTETTYIGHTMDFYMYLPSSADAGVEFGHDGTDRYQIHLDDADDEHRIERDTSSGVTILNTSSTTIPTGEWLRIEVAWLPDEDGTIRSRIYSGSSFDTLEDESKTTGESQLTEGGYGFFADTAHNVYWDHSADRAVELNARALEGGTVGNVGANTLTELPTVPSGVNSVTNRYAMGDPARYLTTLSQYTVGRPEEDDDDLRERARVSEGTAKGTVASLIGELRTLDVESLTIYENKTNTDNTGSGGLPEKSFEVVFHGAEDNQTIAETIFDTMGVTSRDYGGAHGTEVTENVEAENGQTWTIHWTNPNELNVDMTLDLVVNDTYVGDDDIRDRIVEYIGGTLTDGTTTLGTDTDEDVYINQLEDAIVGPDDSGVIGVDTSGTSYTPSTTTDSNGLEIIDVGSDETAKTDATDGSITITTTTV